MSYIIAKNLIDFANDVIHPEALIQEIGVNENITTTLERIREKEDGSVELWFESEPSAGEKTEIDSVVAAHSGNPPLKFSYLVPTKLIENTKEITEDQNWQDLGGVVTTLGAFMADVSKAWGRVIGQIKSVGTGAQIRVIRESDGVLLMTAPYDVPNTENVWQHCQCWVNQNQPADTDCFILQGRLNGATSLHIRYVSMSLLEKLE